MSQRAIFVTLNGVLYEEVFHYIPDHDELVQLCRDEGYEADMDTVSDYIYAEYEWIEIGEGEADMDEFISEEALLHIYQSGDLAETISKTYNLRVDIIEYGDEEILLEELEE